MKHLDLEFTTLIDKNYLKILEFPSLERFDVSVKIPKIQRQLIFEKNKTIKAGFFIDWDWDKNEMKNGIEW